MLFIFLLNCGLLILTDRFDDRLSPSAVVS